MVEALDARRQALVAELVTTVRRATSYDHEALEAVIAASLSDAASSAAGLADSHSQLEGAINRLLESAKAFPELSANPDFVRIKAGLESLAAETIATPGAFRDPDLPVGPDRALDAAIARTNMGMLSLHPMAADEGLDAAEGVVATSLFADDAGPSATERAAAYARASGGGGEDPGAPDNERSPPNTGA
jgi:hypothetical protein